MCPGHGLQCFGLFLGTDTRIGLFCAIFGTIFRTIFRATLLRGSVRGSRRGRCRRRRDAEVEGKGGVDDAPGVQRAQRHGATGEMLLVHA